MQLSGKTALITGAASGLGKEIAQRYAVEGAQVVITDINQSAGEAVAASIGDSARYMMLDVTSEDDWINVTGQLKELDIVVNNAGITNVQFIEDLDVDDVRKIMDVDVLGLLLGCKHGIKAMKASGGSIINIASALAKKAEPQTVAYCGAKAAACAITRSVALDCAQKGYNIRCNAILPGIFHTDMLDKAVQSMPDPEAALKAWSAKQPTGRLGKVEELSALATFLASDASEFMTGSEILIDGGNSLK